MMLSRRVWNLLRTSSLSAKVLGPANFCSATSTNPPPPPNTTSTTSSPTNSEKSKFIQLASSEGVDPSSPYVIYKRKKCDAPRDAETNLLDFLNRSDVGKRKINTKIPFFLPGSYLSVTRADPYSPSGESTFAGICIARRKIKQLGSTFILRNVISRMGVEMMYELYSPAIKEIRLLKLERRRRAKLYYLRDKPPRFSTVNEKMVPIKTPKGTIPLHRRRGAAA